MSSVDCRAEREREKVPSKEYVLAGDVVHTTNIEDVNLLLIDMVKIT
jgi:hypothetical protein